MHDILNTLGVRDDTLSEDERAFLDEQGYLPLPGVFADHLDALRQRVEELAEEEGDRAGWEFRAAAGGAAQNRQDTGALRLSDLVNKGTAFDVCYTHPRVLAAIAHVLDADFRLSSLNYRASLPGHGLQPLHADWKEAVAPGAYQVCNSIWLLDDFTPENGATRIVPGSHRWGQRPQDVLEDVLAPHPQEIQLLGSAGTVVIFNSHTWHGGTRNRTDQPRRALHSHFCRRHQPQQTDQRRYIRPETRRRMSPAARHVVDV